MSDVFISYASEDRDGASKLAHALEARGWSVWWDRDIATGQAYDQVIERELARAGCVVVLWSAHSITSEWVKNEATAGSERGVLLPAAIERVATPLEFRRRQTADLVDWNGDANHGGLAALCSAITSTLGATTAKPPAPLASSQPRPHQRLVLALALCAVFALTLGAYFAGAQRSPSPQSESHSNSTPKGGPRAGSVQVESPQSQPDLLGTGPAPARASSSRDLLSKENGGQLLLAPSDDWSAAIDGKLDSYKEVRVGEAAVFGFEGERAETFNSFGILIVKTGRNPKEFELLVGDESTTGAFRSIGTFHPENAKVFKTGGWQDFSFPEVTARYLKVRMRSNHEDVVWIAVYEFRLMRQASK